MEKISSDPTWKELGVGFVIDKPGNSREYETGTWRSLRPVVDTSKCISCGVCYIFCPDMAVHKTEEGFFGADLYFCKGCGICAFECFTQCITMVAEEE